MIRQPWRNWYHCMVGTYGQWLPGDPRGWHERHHHEHAPTGFAQPPEPAPFAKARQAHSQRIMNWRPYLILPEDRRRIGSLLVESLQIQHISVLVLAVSATHFHTLVQIPDQAPKRVLGLAKRHVTFRFAAVVDPATNQRRQIWEGGVGAKPIRDRNHGTATFQYILNHRKEGAWVWSYRDVPQYDPRPARAVENGGRHE